MPLHIESVTKVERLEAVARVREVLAGCGGWILDHHAFSSVSFQIAFEVDAARYPELYPALAAAGIHAKLVPSDEPGRIQASLQITFIHDGPDVRDHIPAVPG